MLVATPSRVFTADSAPAMTARESGAGLYSRQDVESDRIATLEKGEALTPIAESVGSEIWYMVRRQQGSVGWVRAADVVLSNQAKDAFKEKQPSSSTWSARTSGGPRDRSGISLFVVDRHSANLHLQGFKTIDGRRAAEVALMNVEVPASQLLGTEGEGVAALEACRDRAIAALCAEAIGAMTELNAATLEYSKTRKQFGVALGSFQVLQHRMVDMFIALEEAVSLTQHLSLCLVAGEPHGSRLASGAKTKVGYAARFIAEQAIQLHGGMGMSDELNVGHYFKRIASINVQFGDPTYHLMRYARQNESGVSSDAAFAAASNQG